MYKTFLLTILFLGGNMLNAQHCIFDFTGIVVLKIQTPTDNAIIPNLTITLLDSSGKAIDTFWQNPSKTTFMGYIDNENPGERSKIRIPFAKNNYVLMCGYHFPLGKYLIKIEDFSHLRKPGNHKTTIIKPTDKDVYPLCGTYNYEDYPKNYNGRHIKYRPIEIILQQN